MDKTLKNIKSSNLYSINYKNLFKKNACPICKRKKFKLISEVIVYKKLINKTILCIYCNNIFRQVSPKNSWFEYCWKKIEVPKPKEISLKLEKLREKRYKYYLSNLKKIHNFKKVLDIGSAFGTGIDVFRKKGYETHCVEPEINRYKVLKKKKFRSFNLTIEKLKIKNKYDLILMSHSLEHCEDINKSINIINSLLKNNKSLLYVEVPDATKCIDFYDNFYLPHRNNFNKNNLTFFFEKHNFEIIQTKKIFFSDEGHSLGLILRKSNKKIKAKKPNSSKKNENKILKSYLKKIPIKKNKLPLRINVDHIRNFFYIMRKDEGAFYLKKNQIFFKHF